MDATHFATMPQLKLARVATALMEEVVALKGLVGKESPVAKVYAELDAAHQAERDMLRRAVRPLNVWKFCLESTEYSALKSMGGKRSDCAAVMCGVASLLGDIGVCMPPTAMGRAGALMYKVPDPVLFIDLCGEESTDDEDELPVASSVTAIEEKVSQAVQVLKDAAEASAAKRAKEVEELKAEQSELTGSAAEHGEIPVATSVPAAEENASQDKETVETASAAAVPAILDNLNLAQTTQPDPLLSVTSAAYEFNRNSGTAWRKLADGGGGTVDREKYTAAQCYERAIEIDSKDFRAWFRLGFEDGGCVQGKSFSKGECMVQFLGNDPNAGFDEQGVYKYSFVTALSAGNGTNDEDYDDYDYDDGYNHHVVKAWSTIGFEGGGCVNGQYATAQECFGYAIRLAGTKDASKQRRVISVVGAPAWRKLGFSGGGCVNGEDFTPAQCFAKALEIEPTVDSWCFLAMKGGGLVSGQNYTQAQCYGRVLEIDPRRSGTWRLVGEAGRGDAFGRTYTEVECYIKVLELDDGADAVRYETWLEVAELWGGGRVNGKDYTTGQCMAKALEIKPDVESSVWRYLGKEGGGLVSGQNYTAAQCYGRALEINPLCGASWSRLAKAGGGDVLGRTYSAADCKVKADQVLLINKNRKK